MDFLKTFGEKTKSKKCSVLEYNVFLCFGDDVTWVQLALKVWKLYTKDTSIPTCDNCFGLSNKPNPMRNLS